MKRSLLTFILAALVAIPAATVIGGQYSPDFGVYLAEHQSDRMIGATIAMADRVDLEALKQELYARRADRRDWHEAVVRALQDKATESQAGILAQLAHLASQGMVEDYQGVWVANMVLVRATREALDILVQRDDVYLIEPDYPIENIEPVARGEDGGLIVSVEPGLRAIRADDVWAMGYTGAGRLVSHLDTGVDGNHPALNARWRGYDSRYDDHPEWAWFDPVTNTEFPFDSGAHGTHTMGTICGLGEGTGDTVGVAFGAEWISAGVIDRVSIPRTVADAILAFEWTADPDEDPGTVWDVPDCNSNSWGVATWHGYEQCDPIFWDVLDGCEAAGVFVVFAAGNEGPSARSLRNPASRATTDIKSFSVGALDGNSAPNYPIAGFSSRGPSDCTPDGTDTFKPEVAAPGVNVRSSVPGGGYQGGWSGTSMACPHVAGVVALMREANPNLTTDQIGEILLETAVEVPADGVEGEDNTYGMGMVDAFEAVTLALAYLEGWGTLAGYITDQASGDPIQGARVGVIDRDWSTTSNSLGYYRLFMPADTLWDLKIENPPTHLPIFDQRMVAENETLWVDYALEGKVTVTLRASFANPEDASYRSFYLKGSWDNDGFYDETWSGDLIEIRDDGQAPDDTAEDGVFTGEVLLARDEVNTYSWAIYSENYGGEDARLDDGADFDIPDLDPPDVPTLVVNPSGDDNNWIITVEGDNGLYLDLSQGIDNDPDKWGGATDLEDGVTYTFRFYVMHSDVASYGSGGIGGADLQFTCEYSGAYDFIFDDSDDSHLVQLTGTEGPPTYLTAQSGLDHHIPLSWLPPGTVESQELAYDDGQLQNGYYYFAYDNLMATMFVPADYPVAIDSVMVHVLTEGDPYWPWPDGNPDPVGISIFLDNGSGYPENDPVFYTEITGELGEWIRVDVDEIVVSDGNFWVAMNNLPGGGEEGMGLDANTDYPANKWARESGVWGMQNIYNGDHMIRAKVFGGGRLLWMGEGSSPVEEVSIDVPILSGAAATRGTSEGMRALSDPGELYGRMAYHPMLASTDPVDPLDIQVLAGYNLYRDTSPGPYDRGLQINAELITETHYDDWGDDPYGPIVNGVTYFYQASAVYDVGGGDFVEVGPSNEVTAMAVNHPPAEPVLNEPEVVGFEVNLSWAFEDSIGDLDYFNVYRKLMPFGDWIVVGSPVDANFTDVIPDGQDGSYGYEVTAVDDGDPPLESDRSNTVYAFVGHLPPSGLVATDGFEFAVPLSWNLPGSWRRARGPDNPLSSVPPGDDRSSRATTAILDLSHKGDNGPVNPPVILDEGGPDEFGYRWIDSDEPGGPSYNWVDITDRGQQLFMSDDDNQGPFPLDFDFGFYDQEFSSFRVCSNGWISFTSTWGDYFNYPIPDPGVMENLIAPFWDDFNPSVGGQVWVYTNQDSAIVSWINVPHYGGGGPYTVQVILRRSGAIFFQYQDVNYPDDSATIGIQNSDGSIGLQVVYNAPYVHDELAIRIGTGPEGIPPDFYRLYRSLESPVPVDPGYMIADNIPGEETSYLDTDGLENGTTYYYVLTAVWFDGVESPPSNEADGTPANHPPVAPTDLGATVDDRDVTLNWAFTDPIGDFDHFNIYKKLVPGGDFELDGTSTETSYVMTISEGEDGTYAIVVTAVDDGEPPLESAYSNQVYASVGNLPPINLRAQSDQENVVPLDWSEPGLMPTVTLAYDDGQLENGYYYFAYDNIMANRFVATPPVQVETLWVHVLTEGDPYWPWPDGTHDPVGVSLWDDNGSGMPGDEVYYEEVVCTPGEWIMVPIEGGILLDGPNFWVGLQNLAGGGEDGMGIDAFTDYPEHKWARESGVWGMQDIYTGDHMIRVTIVDSGRRLRLTEDAPTAELALAKESNSGAQAAGAPVAGDVVALNGIRAATISMGDSPETPLDITVLLGYNVYRSETAGVPTDPDHRVNEEYVTDTAYDDSTVENGTTYYYVATAVYDNDGDIEESPPSNEVSATPMMGARMVLDPTSFEVSLQPGDIVTENLNISNPGGLDLGFSISVSENRIRGGDDPGGDGVSDDSPAPYIMATDPDGSHQSDSDDPVGLTAGTFDMFRHASSGSDPGEGILVPQISVLVIASDEASMYINELSSYDDITTVDYFDSRYGTPSLDQLVDYEAVVVWSNYVFSDPVGMGNVLADYADAGGGVVLHQFCFGSGWNLQGRMMDEYSPFSPGTIQYTTHYLGDYDESSPLMDGVSFVSDIYLSYVSLINDGQWVASYDDGTPFVAFSPDVSVVAINGYVGDFRQFEGDMIALSYNSVIFATGGRWLTVDPRNGTVGPGDDMDVDVIFDATDMEEGTYTATLTVTGYDINHEVGVVEIPVTCIVSATGIDDEVAGLPTEFALSQNYPNPFNPATGIKFALPENAHVRIEIFNILGQKVYTLVDEDMEAGYRSVTWNGVDDKGKNVSSGVYLYRMVAGEKTFTKKMLMLK